MAMTKEEKLKVEGIIEEYAIDPEGLARALISNCYGIRLTDKYLQDVFEIISCPDEDGYGDEWTIDKLEKINPAFRTSNGGSWCRSDGNLGLKYNIIRKKKSGSIYSVKLDGFNFSESRQNRTIRPDIVKEIKKRRCAILDVSEVEADHKNGKYNESRINNLEDQKLEDFQALCRSANLAKREHCKKCKDTGRRFDARILGYNTGWIKGDENSVNCAGCYWYDPIKFNQTVSDTLDVSEPTGTYYVIPESELNIMQFVPDLREYYETKKKTVNTTTRKLEPVVYTMNDLKQLFQTQTEKTVLSILEANGIERIPGTRLVLVKKTDIDDKFLN